MRLESHTVVKATRQDVPALAGMLARAFLDDPVAGWACRPDALRPGMLERFHGARLRHLLAHEEVWSTPDLHPRLMVRMPLVVTGLLGMERRHPREVPHWYLATLGTDPSEQGQGLGSAVLEPVLARCDEDGVGAYLESSKERNIDFYARHGFRVTGELRLPRGPSVWPMWRDPRV